ncbi:SH3 domain protein [Calycina marina]|uniref:SH3 domain protein n=1 Tax=Calycina marina TaxID=1763456 RepID=A0A9P7Z9U7_9HELO|nr:SH3 domain protein [Calycina marina]
MSSLPFKVKAVFEYTSPHDDDLHFINGQIITVTEEEDDDWYSGEYVDAAGVKQEGIFPRNFVEKYEPVAPARPTRAPRPKKETELAPAPPSEPVMAPEPEPEPEQEDSEPEVAHAPIASQPSPGPESLKSPPPPRAADISAPPVAKPVQAASRPSAPPPASEKPGGNSFRDRIAAFNKAAPPPAPFKPGGLSSGGPSSFIKKPFVAPPPSKNAYIPTQREPPPQKVYRREEDPEIAAKEAENHEQAINVGVAPTMNVVEADDQPKPMTLKERMALLQKQQAEQASRHADAAAKKEKPKRPAKKRTESHETTTEPAEDVEGATLKRQDTADTIGGGSMDIVKEESVRRNKSTKSTSGNQPLSPRISFGDGNEADESGADDTTEGAEESTERDDGDEKPKSRGGPPIPIRAPAAPLREPDVGEEDGASEEGEPDDEECDDMDPEVRRKEELRARMAKMSGGMGMHGMFGAPMPMPAPAPPKKKKPTGTSESRTSGEYGSEDIPSRAPPVPMPGLSKGRSPEEIHPQPESEVHEPTPVSNVRPADEVPDVEDVVPERGPLHSLPIRESGAPPIPAGRPAPPPVPVESRALLYPPPAAQQMSPSAGSESDDELSERPETRALETPIDGPPRPPAGSADMPDSPQQTSYFFSAEPTPSSPITPGISKDRRGSRVPPIPGALPTSNTLLVRAPPPPPPSGMLSRSSTGDHYSHNSKPASHDLSEEEVTEYEGDYDTDIASAEPHKDALKAHKESAEEPFIRAPAGLPPPLPPVSAPRAVPPPPPLSQPAPSSRPVRSSVDMPRAAPPPLPTTSKAPAHWEQGEDDEYDPYRYMVPPKQAAPSIGTPTPRLERRESDIYSVSPPRSYASPAQNREPPPPPPPIRDDQPPARAPPRQSLDVSRTPNPSRRSADLGRMALETGFVANDVDLARSSFWWTQPKGIPPVFQSRKDILLEFEESTAAGRGGKATVTKEVYVLFQDYSQTIVSAEFDAQNPGDVELEQKHEQPPSRSRQDQLEQAHEQFGREIYKAITSKKETVVSDGTPQGLIQELLKPFSSALLPVGTRAYGAIVYGNLANASTQQNDEIRPGDIITFRNAKFQGKHGPMHAKYSTEVGKPDHVGVVAEWDGTKKKVRAWEQGREGQSRKVKLESFKLDDLRSGEVKIWRVMPRSWVGWQGVN